MRTEFCLLAVVLACVVSMPIHSQKPVTIPEEVEWTWEVRPPNPNPALPNVLLLGDSITRNYFPEVRKNLAGIANVYLMASSTSVGDPRLPRQIGEFAAAERIRFRVVHFNNGMHGWAYTEEQYRRAFPGYLRAVRSLAGGDGALIWASITPVRSDAPEGPTNARIDERNRIAMEVAHGAGIMVDDQAFLMRKHEDLYEDSVHFNSSGAALQADQATAAIRRALRLPQ